MFAAKEAVQTQPQPRPHQLYIIDVDGAFPEDFFIRLCTDASL